MIATLVIGLREGLEAALIVGIIAAFLRKNGKPLTAMWIGVGLAVALSIAVGVALRQLEQALPQQRQEALESVIGAVAIVFVTSMIVWMNTHARGMKQQLETEAAHALSHGGAQSLAIMAFLAVLKEGFETSVFLLATFSAAQSARLAAIGAVVGVLIAIGIGWGIYAGGVRLNLSRFFRYTGAFLVLVATGLVITMLRTAHEAGWIVAGQQKTVDLHWLVKTGTVQSALITGVLGIPADPRRIEMMGWFVYLIPVALFVYWPAKHRLKGMSVARLQFGVAGGLLAAAVLLATAYPIPGLAKSAPVSLVSTTGTTTQSAGTAHLSSDSGTLTLTTTLTGAPSVSIPLAAAESTADIHNGIATTAWVIQNTPSAPGTPQTLTLNQLTELAGGRIPVGINPSEHPGPYTVQESTVTTVTVWVAQGVLLDATSTTTTIAKISGSGLASPRTISVPGAGAGDWIVSPVESARIASEINSLAARQAERRLWAIELPIALCLAAALFAIAGFRTRRRYRGPASSETVPAARPIASFGSVARQTKEVHPRSDTFAAH